MTACKQKSLPAPTDKERASARAAAAALLAAIADPSLMGSHSMMHIDLARPRRGEWHETWEGLPGFMRVNGRAYRHQLLPGWEYLRSEIKSELIPDLEALAEQGVRPGVDA